MKDKEKDIVIDVSPKTLEAEIGAAIEQFKSTRSEAQANLKDGYRLKRTVFDSIEEKGLAEPKALYAEFQKIEKKQSRLSSGERQLITDIAMTSMQKVFLREIDEARKAGDVKPEIPKKKRIKKAANEN